MGTARAHWPVRRGGLAKERNEDCERDHGGHNVVEIMLLASYVLGAAEYAVVDAAIARGEAEALVPLADGLARTGAAPRAQVANRRLRCS